MNGLVWLVGLAGAAEPERRSDAAPCTPMDDSELRSFVLDAQSAIDRGDIETPAAILKEIDRRVGCFTFVVPSRVWADLQVARAIVEFSSGGDWESPMAAALRIRPSIDRGVGPGHPLYRWEPPAPGPTGPPVPTGHRLYVDGLASPVMPPETGTYLVQKTDPTGRTVNSRMLHDEALDPQWAAAPLELPPRIASWGRVGARFSGGSQLQDASWTSDVFPDVSPSAAGFALTGDTQVTFYSPFGVLAHGDVGWMLAPQADGRVAAIGTWRGFTAGAGLGRQLVLLTQNTYDSAGTGTDAVIVPIHPVQVLQYGHLTANVRSGGEVKYDVGGTLGASAATTRFELTFGLVVPVAGQRYRLGAWVDRRAGRFRQVGLPERELASTIGTFALSLEWVRGDY
ncbi:MAG: hypothetical protein ABMA64_27955 [Myxococcota bacterium]